MVLQKARSRLHSTSSSDLIKPGLSSHQPFSWRPNMAVSPKSMAIWDACQPWVKRWPQLLIGLCVLFAWWQLLAAYPPLKLAHIIWPNSYLPVLALWFVGGWYVSSFGLQSSRRGLLMAILLTTWLSTRLQMIVIPDWFWLSLLGGWLIIEFTWRKVRQFRPHQL